MLHWRATPQAVQRILPEGLVADEHDGSAWVSLVPFVMRDLTAPPVPALPWIGTFAETNIRTYVDGPAGPGVWFCSLEVPRLAALPIARLGFGQPYTWSRMHVARRGPEIRYWSRRRLPGPAGARSHVGLRIGERITPDALDAFLINRWGAYSTIRGALHHARVVHDPWPLRTGRVTVLHDELGAAAGLPIGPSERVHHAEEAAAVAFDRPRRVRAARDLDVLQ